MFSESGRRGPAPIERRHLPVFAALGDRLRLELVVKLGDGEARSIADLAAGTRVSRQAIRKHLAVLERAGLVRGRRAGRESRFELVPRPLADARRYLETISPAVRLPVEFLGVEPSATESIGRWL